MTQQDPEEPKWCFCRKTDLLIMRPPSIAYLTRHVRQLWNEFFVRVILCSKVYLPDTWNSLFSRKKYIRYQLQFAECLFSFPSVSCIQSQDIMSLYISGTFRWPSLDGILMHLARSSFITLVCWQIHICIYLYIFKRIGSCFFVSNAGLSSHHLSEILIV